MVLPLIAIVAVAMLIVLFFFPAVILNIAFFHFIMNPVVKWVLIIGLIFWIDKELLHGKIFGIIFKLLGRLRW